MKLKKLLTGLVLLAVSGITFCNSVPSLDRQFTIFNMGDNDITINYNACFYIFDTHDPHKRNHLFCDYSKSILIKAKKIPNDKNYIVLSKDDYRSPSWATAMFLNIENAEEKNEEGIAYKTNWVMLGSSKSSCGWTVYSILPKLSQYKTVLNDMKGSPFITCSFVS